MKANIVIMGQSGNGKSTIVNAIMGKYAAPTGKGAAVTTENKIYSTTYNIDNTSYELNLYDTVGIELSEAVTCSTLNDIENHLKVSKMNSCSSDINLVWFCINNKSSRFQDFEVDLIRKLSFEYEIPFVIVMTQCLDNQIGELENNIRSDLPDVTTTRILAEDYKLRGGMKIPAYGLDDLLKLSLLDFGSLKARVLESKLNSIQQELEVSQWFVKLCDKKAAECVERHTASAEKIGWLPVGCIPFVHGICIKMITELHKIYGMPSNESFAENIFANVLVGIISTPLMVVPILSAGIAYAYVSSVGEAYASALSCVVQQSKYGELHDQKLMSERIKQQLNQSKGR